LFEAGCVGCHGGDGKGQPQTILGFVPPSSFPDFSDCPTTSPEPDSTWRAIITNGGSFRGFSEIMPSFKEQLSEEQIDRIIGYLRSLCSDASWPRGDMNLPRPLYTDKAFPETETIVTNDIAVNKTRSAVSQIVYEQRFGRG